jgi:peptidoglycan/LPS O-acetylase OafA/YrhL
MRALAVFSVLVVHAAVFGRVGDSIAGKLLLHLNVGVTIFFLISGFLLYRPFIAHRTGGGASPAIGTYARRRLLRILPAYWLVLAVLIVLPGLTGIPGSGGIQQFALLHTLPLGDGPACVTSVADCGLAQTWSLVVEFTFYAALPLYVIAAAALARGRSSHSWLRAELTLLAVLAAASTLLHFVVVDTAGVASAVGGTVLGYFLWFALGMAMALVSVAIAGRDGGPPRFVGTIGSHPDRFWLAALVIYLACALVLPATPYLVGGGDQLLAYLAFGLVALLLMLPAVFADSEGGAPRAFLSARPVAWLGLISYGIFLWHYVVALEFGVPGEGWSFLPLLLVTIAITVPVAAASYYLLERPLLRFKR